MEDTIDAIIIGSGAAGLSAALSITHSDAYRTASDGGHRPSLLVISKLQPLRSHTGSAEGGIAASLANMEPDHWQWHYYDTIKGGDWLADQDAVAILAQEAPRTVINLERMGAAFSRTADGHIAQRRFGGHTAEYGKAPVKRAAYAADRIGHQILHTLWQQCVAAGVDVAEEWYVTDVIVDEEHHAVCGVIAFDTTTGTVHAVRARSVLFATGGAGRLFHTTSNSWDLTGDGMALALRCGMQMEDLEFMQFHPTGLAHTGILLSEAARAEGGVLRNAKGEAFMTRYAPEHGDLAARDVVSRAIISEVEAGRGVADPRDPQGPRDCVWLDLRDIDTDHLHRTLPQVVETIERYANLDPHTDLIAIKPTAHYTMGGIPIDTDGRIYQWQDGQRKPMLGLFAAGECACVSVHGANRLGGNSLLDACLFGTRAGASMAQLISATDPYDGEVDDERRAALVQQAAQARRDDVAALLDTGEHDTNTDDNPYRLMADLGAVMERAAAVQCDESSLRQALHDIDTDLRPRAERLRAHSEIAIGNQELTAIWEVRNLLCVATVMLRSALSREESRGAFHRLDHPGRDDNRFLAHTMTDAHGTVTWQPVHITDMPPQQRAY